MSGEEKSHFPTIIEIYKKSIISVEEFYRNCLIVSYKTANTQYDCERMEYWKFNNMLVFLDEIVSKENGDSPSGDQQQQTDYQRQAKSQQHQAMQSAKSMMKRPSIPKLR